MSMPVKTPPRDDDAREARKPQSPKKKQGRPAWLLRMAVDLHRGVDRAPLPDPLGGAPIGVTREGDTVRLHCAGADEHSSLARMVALRR